MQFTGQTGGRHLPQPLQSSGTMITSMPWLKIAPNCGGQCRMHVSQLMHSDISMRSGGFCHFWFRSCDSIRSGRVTEGTSRLALITIALLTRRGMSTVDIGGAVAPHTDDRPPSCVGSTPPGASG